MPTFFNKTEPKFIKDKQSGEVIEIHHNHYEIINYNSYTNGNELRDSIQEEVVKLRGCIGYFKAVKEDNSIDGLTRASALAALEYDNALLKNHQDHMPCTII